MIRSAAPRAARTAQSSLSTSFRRGRGGCSRQAVPNSTPRRESANSQAHFMESKESQPDEAMPISDKVAEPLTHASGTSEATAPAEAAGERAALSASELHVWLRNFSIFVACYFFFWLQNYLWSGIPVLRSLLVCGANATSPQNTTSRSSFSGSAHCSDREGVIGEAQNIQGWVGLLRGVVGVCMTPVLSYFADHHSPVAAIAVSASATTVGHTLLAINSARMGQAAAAAVDAAGADIIPVLPSAVPLYAAANAIIALALMPGVYLPSALAIIVRLGSMRDASVRAAPVGTRPPRIVRYVALAAVGPLLGLILAVGVLAVELTNYTLVAFVAAVANLVCLIPLRMLRNLPRAAPVPRSAALAALAEGGIARAAAAPQEGAETPLPAPLWELLRARRWWLARQAVGVFLGMFGAYGLLAIVVSFAMAAYGWSQSALIPVIMGTALPSFPVGLYLGPKYVARYGKESFLIYCWGTVGSTLIASLLLAPFTPAGILIFFALPGLVLITAFVCYFRLLVELFPHEVTTRHHTTTTSPPCTTRPTTLPPSPTHARKPRIPPPPLAVSTSSLLSPPVPLPRRPYRWPKPVASSSSVPGSQTCYAGRSSHSCSTPAHAAWTPCRPSPSSPPAASLGSPSSLRASPSSRAVRPPRRRPMPRPPKSPPKSMAR